MKNLKLISKCAPKFAFLQIILFFVLTANTRAQSVSPYLVNKNFKDNKNYKLEISNIANTTLSRSAQVNAYERGSAPDLMSKNYNNRSINFGFDNQLYAKSLFKLDKNYVGATAKFELNFNSNSKKEKPNLDQIFLYLDNDFGKFEFGNYLAVNQKMKYGPARFAKGAGGINGKYLEYVNLPVLAQNNSSCNANIFGGNCQNIEHPRFILLAQSPIGHGGYSKGFYPRDVDNNYAQNNIADFNKNNFRALKDDSFEGLEDALKFSFYSKKINDFQLGFSYSPSSSNQGFTAKTAPDSRDLKLKDIFSFGANYSADFDNLNLALSTTAEYAKAKNFGVARNNLWSYDIGSSLSYFGFTVGASYGYWGKSLSAKDGVYKNQKNSFYYSSGIAYEIGPIRSSVTTLDSNFQNNKYRALSFGVDYKIKKNLITYIELTKYKFVSNQANYFDFSSQIKVANSSYNIQNNSGNVLLAGIYYIF